jgi:hypothetical protein
MLLTPTAATSAAIATVSRLGKWRMLRFLSFFS